MAPCYHCKQRRFKCHSECPRYKDWRAELDKSKAEPIYYTPSKENTLKQFLKGKNDKWRKT